MATDGLFRSGALAVANERAASRPVHAYQFEVASRLLDGTLGAPHCMELPFTFANIGRWSAAPMFQALPAAVIQRVTAAVHNAWIGFIRDGRPDHGALPEWPSYTAEERAVLVISEDDVRVAG